MGRSAQALPEDQGSDTPYIWRPGLGAGCAASAIGGADSWCYRKDGRQWRSLPFTGSPHRIERAHSWIRGARARVRVFRVILNPWLSDTWQPPIPVSSLSCAATWSRSVSYRESPRATAGLRCNSLPLSSAPSRGGGKSGGKYGELRRSEGTLSTIRFSNLLIPFESLSLRQFSRSYSER
jgi:hypothetical protein